MAESSNVKVYVRQRPFTKQEQELRRSSIVQLSTTTDLWVKSSANEKKYTFDRVFSSHASQEEVYKVVVDPLVDFVVSGYTCTVFAYGQTGTGKTFTIIGQKVAPNIDFINDPNTGIIPRAAIHLFNTLKSMNIEYAVTVSFIEIYNEEVRDLLVKDSPSLRVFDDACNKGGTRVKGLSECRADDMFAVYDLLNIGILERHTASTNLNRSSSRSHTIFTLVVNTREISADGKEIIKTGKLNLIDLAGSENIGRSGATEIRAREAGNINKSLLTLGKVIKALALKQQHIPYRESKLTRILQDGLGGNSKTCMIATFSPIVENFDETASTLDYAHFAKSVANCPTVNIHKQHTTVLKSLQDQVVLLRQELDAAKTGEGFFMNDATYEEINFNIKSKQERIFHLMMTIKELEEEIAIKKQYYEELDNSFKRTSSIFESVSKELEEENRKRKQIQRILEHMNSEFSEVKDVANTLLNVCESSTKHETIYNKKYDIQCNTILHNAKVAKSIHSVAATCLTEIQHSHDSFTKSQHNYLNGTGKPIHCIEQKSNYLCEKINSKPENRIDGLLENNEFTVTHIQNIVNKIFDDNHQTLLEKIGNVKITLDNVETNVIEHITEVEKETTNCKKLITEAWSGSQEYDSNLDELMSEVGNCLKESTNILEEEIDQNRRYKEAHEQFLKAAEENLKFNRRKAAASQRLKEAIKNAVDQMHNNPTKHLSKIRDILVYYNVCMKSMKSVGLLVRNAIDTVAETEKKCHEENNLNEVKTSEYLQGFFSTFTTKLNNYIKELNDGYRDWLGNVESACEELEKTSNKSCKDIENSIEYLLNCQKTYAVDVEQFINETVNTIQSFKKNIEHKVHSGDTPVKPVYNYSKKIEKKLSEELLRAQFDKSMSDIQ